MGRGNAKGNKNPGDSVESANAPASELCPGFDDSHVTLRGAPRRIAALGLSLAIIVAMALGLLCMAAFERSAVASCVASNRN